MKLLKGNGGTNDNHSTDMKDFRVGKKTRTPAKSMPKPNLKNTSCKSGPLKPSKGK